MLVQCIGATCAKDTTHCYCSIVYNKCRVWRYINLIITITIKTRVEQGYRIVTSTFGFWLTGLFFRRSLLIGAGTPIEPLKIADARFLKGWMPSLSLNQQCQSTERTKTYRTQHFKEQEAQLMLTTGSTRLAVSRGKQTWYHSTCYI